MSLSAMLCTRVIVFPLVLLGVRGSEPLWIATSAMLEIVMWRRRIERWVDEQRDLSQEIPANRSMLQDTLRLLLRGAAFFLFLLFRTVFIPVNHQHAGEVTFCLPADRVEHYPPTAIAWGERRETRLAG